MRSYRRLIPGMLCALALTLSAEAWAAPMVLFDVNDLGGGLFQYDLTVDNTGGSEPLNGLLVLQGGSVFGLDPTSAIGAPQDVGGNPAADWSFIAPVSCGSSVVSLARPYWRYAAERFAWGLFFPEHARPCEPPQRRLCSGRHWGDYGKANSLRQYPIRPRTLYPTLARHWPQRSSRLRVATEKAGVVRVLSHIADRIIRRL
jgi:hypothetical protein